MTTLDQAPIGVPLVIDSLGSGNFAARMERLGLYRGAGLTRFGEYVELAPVKVRGVKGEAVLSGFLASQVVIHLDDDRRLPLLECGQGDQGHVEGVTGHDLIESSLRELGIVENDRLTFVRRMPPMTYKFTGGSRGGGQMNEALAVHILGLFSDRMIQFCSAGAGEPFLVKVILPGERVQETLARMGVVHGAELVLTSVAVTSSVRNTESGLDGADSVVCMTADGFRLYIPRADAAHITVEERNAWRGGSGGS